MEDFLFSSRKWLITLMAIKRPGNLNSLEKIAADGQLAAYQHEGFWQSMDTLRDVNVLEKFWREGNAPWKLWN